MQRLEKYEIIREIGHGGMATVYEARDTTLERTVALKVLHPHLQPAPEARVRFAREARSVAKLRHPNIPEVFDYSGEGSARSFIAGELLDGPTLKQYIEESPQLPAEIAACLAIQIASALVAAHEAGIVHRDVKPENVLLHRNQLVKLTDFGIAQVVGSHSFTHTGQVLGSPGHMAPEQIETGHCDERSDVFALGTVLYYAATRQLPFEGRNAHQLLRRVAEAQYVDPLRVDPGMGSRLAAIVNKALARQPTERHQTAAELRSELLSFVAEIGIQDPDAALRAYLAHPATERERLRSLAIERLERLGQRALERHDTPRATAYFNRVLALEPGNRRVLSLLAKARKRRRWRWAVPVAAGGLVLLGLGVWQWSEASSESPQQSSGQPVESRPFSVAPSPPAQASQRLQPAAPASAATSAEAAGTARPRKPEASEITNDSGQVSQRHRPRTIVFRPQPQNVAIGVNGQDPVPFGPSFRTARLRPGLHTFTVVGAQECCKDRVIRHRIPPGRTPYPLKLDLEFRPAGLYVVTNVPAEVQVDGGRVEGRSREVLRVPMRESLESVLKLRVTAPGYESYTGTVKVRAGAVNQVEVRLEPKEKAT